jgi:hypothetical protein
MENLPGIGAILIQAGVAGVFAIFLLTKYLPNKDKQHEEAIKSVVETNNEHVATVIAQCDQRVADEKQHFREILTHITESFVKQLERMEDRLNAD